MHGADATVPALVNYVRKARAGARHSSAPRTLREIHGGGRAREPSNILQRRSRIQGSEAGVYVVPGGGKVVCHSSNCRPQEEHQIGTALLKASRELDLEPNDYRCCPLEL